MGLLGAVAKTAVISGTATATRNAVNRRQMEKNVASVQQARQQVYAQQAPPPQAAAPAAAAAPADSMEDKLEQLERLGQLKAQGILTEEEFAQQKAAILG